jgi:putative FmdB family regulatory protein
VPLYEYQCARDGTFERMQKFSDPPLETCPKCGGPVEKLLSAPAIQFKGSGWYVTDYARKSSGGSEGGRDGGGGTESKGKGAGAKDSGSSGAASGSSSSSSGAGGSSSGDKKASGDKK